MNWLQSSLIILDVLSFYIILFVILLIHITNSKTVCSYDMLHILKPERVSFQFAIAKNANILKKSNYSPQSRGQVSFRTKEFINNQSKRIWLLPFGWQAQVLPFVFTFYWQLKKTPEWTEWRKCQNESLSFIMMKNLSLNASRPQNTCSVSTMAWGKPFPGSLPHHQPILQQRKIGNHHFRVFPWWIDAELILKCFLLLWISEDFPFFGLLNQIENVNPLIHSFLWQ